MGAVSTGEDPEPLGRIRARIGEAFQVADDLKDVTAPKILGKPTGQDIKILDQVLLMNLVLMVQSKDCKTF